MQQRRLCLFCERIADSREHLWPEWVIERLKPGRPAITRFDIKIKKFSYISCRLGIKSKCVCSRCNRGWMSDLENSARPIVGSLIQDVYLPLDREQQKIITLWAYKTSMVMESLSRSCESAFYRKDERQQLRLRCAIPFPGFIWLGRYGGTYDVASFGMSIWNDIPEKPGTIHGYVSTMVAGRLAIQLLTFHVPEEYSNRAVPIDPCPGPWAVSLIPIWPYKRTVSWPPEITITDSGLLSLKLFAGRWSKGIAPPNRK